MFLLTRFSWIQIDLPRNSEELWIGNSSDILHKEVKQRIEFVIVFLNGSVIQPRTSGIIKSPFSVQFAHSVNSQFPSISLQMKISQGKDG